MPATVVAAWLHAGTWVFVLAALALIPLARWIGTATEAVAGHLGPGLGGLLNATFGNAAELIIGIAALKAGQTAVVKASITGSILGNLLFVFGAAVLAAGLKEPRPRFNATAALSSSALMYLAVVALVMPDLFHATLGASVTHLMRPLSLLVSVILVVLYALEPSVLGPDRTPAVRGGGCRSRPSSSRRGIADRQALVARARASPCSW